MFKIVSFAALLAVANAGGPIGYAAPAYATAAVSFHSVFRKILAPSGQIFSTVHILTKIF